MITDRVQRPSFLEVISMRLRNQWNIDNLPYERFTQIHGGHPGYSNPDGIIATCSSPEHKKVKSIPPPKGYISK